MTPLSRRLIWIFVFGVAVSLAALIASSDQDAIATLLKHDIGSLALKLALVIFAGGLVLTLFRERLSQALEAMAVLGRGSACCWSSVTATASNCATSATA